MSARSIELKKELVNEVASDLKKAKSFIVFEYHGLTAARITELRKELFKADSKLIILKNNILKRSLETHQFNEITENISGPNSIIIGFGDELAPIKSAVNLSKEFDFIKIKGAYLDGKYLTIDEIQTIASIPGREGLYSMLLSCLTAPIRNFMYGLKAVAEKKEN